MFTFFNTSCEIVNVPISNWCFTFLLISKCKRTDRIESNLSESVSRSIVVVVVQLLSCVWLFATPWTLARHTPLSSAVSWSLLRLMSIELVVLSNHRIPCRPLLLLTSVFPNIRVFSDRIGSPEAKIHALYFWKMHLTQSIKNTHTFLFLVCFVWKMYSLVTENMNSGFQIQILGPHLSSLVSFNKLL